LDKGIRLSAMKSDAWSFNFASADLCATVREAIAGAGARAGERKIVIEQLAPDSATAIFDAAQIRTVIDAMLDNAVRFSPRGGRVRAVIGRRAQFISLSVSDQGPGVAPELAARVFDEFSDPDSLHHAEGQRLSLALARQIARAHDGEVTLGCAEAGSTTFTLTLPTAGPRAAKDPAVSAPRSDQVEAAAGRN
jgi:signal transduction histidine kinase